MGLHAGPWNNKDKYRTQKGWTHPIQKLLLSFSVAISKTTRTDWAKHSFLSHSTLWKLPPTPSPPNSGSVRAVSNGQVGPCHLLRRNPDQMMWGHKKSEEEPLGHSYNPSTGNSTRPISGVGWKVERLNKLWIQHFIVAASGQII